MAGSIVKINQVVASSSATATLTGIDTTYNVYRVVASSEYDMAFKVFESNTGISNHGEVNQTSWRGVTYGTNTNEAGNLLIHCFNFSNASNFSYITLEENTFTNSAHLASFNGGAVHSVNEANDSISFHMASGNIASGTFTLYGLRK